MELFAWLDLHRLWVASGLLVGAGFFALLLGTWIIPENASGLVVKRYGRALPPGRLVALDGEAGYQARLLSPGWYLGLWRWAYRVQKIPLVVVRPGEIGLVVAADGKPVPSERMLGREVACTDFQDARAFLQGAVRKEGSWRR